MPWTLKITGPAPGDFEWVWQDQPTELPPVDLPQWPAPPRVKAGDQDMPPGETPDAPAAGGETSAPSFDQADKSIDRIFAPPPRPSENLPTPADNPPAPPEAPLPPMPQPAPRQALVPDAVDNIFPEPMPQNIMGDQVLQPVQQEPMPNAVPNMQPIRQLQAAVLSAPASMYDLGAMGVENLAMPGASAGRVVAAARGVPTPDPRSNPLQGAADFLRRAGESARQQTRRWTGAEEVPSDVGSRVARNVGEAVVPAGKLNSLNTLLKSTGIISGVNSVVGEARHAVGNRSLSDFATPPDWLSGALVSPAMAAPADFNAPPSGNHTIVESVGGPKKVSLAEFYAVGSIVLATAGMVFGPRIYQRFRSGDLPRMRPVTEAPRGTVAISKPGDLARTYDDANAGALRLLRRTGIDPMAAREVENTMRLQTRATANAFADSAINAGRMETPAFTFHSRTTHSLSLAPLETQPVRDYLHIMDTHR
jgi:hypothetical protein